MATFKHTELFGGAIITALPPGFIDASNFRQVPDNQEVYLDSDGYTSIIFDITERVCGINADQDAINLHLQDITDADERVSILASNTVKFTKLPDGTPAYTLLAKQPPVADEQVSNLAIECTAMLVTLVRLEKQSADIVISINVPLLIEEFSKEAIVLENGKLGRSLSAAMAFREEILSSFEIRDWSLFV